MAETHDAEAHGADLRTWLQSTALLSQPVSDATITKLEVEEVFTLHDLSVLVRLLTGEGGLVSLGLSRVTADKIENAVRAEVEEQRSAHVVKATQHASPSTPPRSISASGVSPQSVCDDAPAERAPSSKGAGRELDGRGGTQPGQAQGARRRKPGESLYRFLVRPAEASFAELNTISEPDAIEEALARPVDVVERANFTTNTYLVELSQPSDLNPLILPFGSKRSLWDMLTLSLVLYTAIVLPYLLAFTIVDPPWVSWVDFFADLIFPTDVFLNFHTGYIDEISDELITNKSKIALQYLRSWFVLDVVGSIPWEIGLRITAATGLDMGGDGTAGLQIVKILKVPKLLRLARLFKLLSKIEGAANVGRILLFMLLLALLTHWLAAVYFFIASSDPHSALAEALCGRDHSYFERVPPESQAALKNETIGALSCVPRTTAGEMAIYLESYHIALLVLFGDGIDTGSNGAKFFCIFTALAGACVTAVIFAIVTSLVTQITARAAGHQAKMEAIDRATSRLGLDAMTTMRVQNFFKYRWVRHADYANQEFIDELPFGLRMRVACALHEVHVRKCELFRESDRIFIAAISVTLLPEV